MSEVEIIAQLFHAKPHHVYGPYITRDGYTGYDVTLQDYIARILRHTNPGSHEYPLVVVQIEGFLSKSEARCWLDSIMVDYDSIDYDPVHNTWIATQRFDGMDLEALLMLYPASNPLFRRK